MSPVWKFTSQEKCMYMDNGRSCSSKPDRIFSAATGHKCIFLSPEWWAHLLPVGNSLWYGVMEVEDSREDSPLWDGPSTVLVEESTVLLCKAAAHSCSLSFVLVLIRASRVIDLLYCPCQNCSEVIQPTPNPQKMLITFLIHMATVNSWYVNRETNVWKQIILDNLLLAQVRPFTLHQENNASGNVWEHLASQRGFVNISPVFFSAFFSLKKVHH